MGKIIFTFEMPNLIIVINTLFQFMNLRTFVVFVAILLGKVCLGQDDFSQKILKIQNDTLMSGAGIGIQVIDLENNSVLYGINSKVSYVPGSVLKIVTSAAALELLGANYKFITKLAYVGKIDSSINTLNGNLIIIGGGDPVLGSNYFIQHNYKTHFLDKWLSSIASEGIWDVNGNILIDGSIYDDQIAPDKWIWEDIGNYYGAGAAGISVFDNTFPIILKTGSEPGQPAEIVGVGSKPIGLEFENHVVGADIDNDQAVVYGSPWGRTRKIRGQIPLNSNNFVIKAALPEPGLVLGNELKIKLKEVKINVSGDVHKCTTDSTVVPFYSYKSPPLFEIIEVLNHKSVNLIAEHLAKQIAYEKSGWGTTSEGVRIIKQFWAEKGIETRGMFLEDGSGLSHFNGISPEQIVSILRYMKKNSPDSTNFVNSLPTSGKGTLSVFNPDNFPNGSLRCKSGSMTRVRCYAGYLTTVSGKNLAFSLMFNNFSMDQSDLIAKIEELLISLRTQN